MLWGLLKPEYLFRPQQLLRRIARRTTPPVDTDGLVTVRLPWGGEIRVSPNDDIGKQILTLGVFDLVLTETLWRLAEPGELALDVGANIGYATAVLAERVAHRGARGEVWSFEPHPVLHTELLANCALIQQHCPSVKLKPIAAAASDRRGVVRLEIPPDFAANRGIARVAQRAAERP